MALIKCPECGKDVSTAAEACSHCGFPMKKSINEKQYLGPKPINASWMKHWRKIPSKNKAILTIIYLVNLLILAFFIIMCCVNNGEHFSWSIPASVVTGIISIFTFSFWIAGFICLKTKYANYDGYNVLAVAGFWNNYLIIENKVFEKTHNRHLDGKLPNGRNVKAEFSFWDNSIRITVTK